ncbi:hypothetical protein AK812_SmicGene27009 [Symbiodinium microadriaticum]|uniref:Uncharacterized protein n=1 Tax=Symbiodinium microadriaticum TaxID=2951 RepID=A0A1Q9D7Z9_SYMMI|nr:hypothetical protein AK812_SmicGene27009 [Symbiodinium microadriaticum]
MSRSFVAPDVAMGGRLAQPRARASARTGGPPERMATPTPKYGGGYGKGGGRPGQEKVAVMVVVVVVVVVGVIPV